MSFVGRRVVVGGSAVIAPPPTVCGTATGDGDADEAIDEGADRVDHLGRLRLVGGCVRPRRQALPAPTRSAVHGSRKPGRVSVWAMSGVLVGATPDGGQSDTAAWSHGGSAGWCGAVDCWYQRGAPVVPPRRPRSRQASCQCAQRRRTACAGPRGPTFAAWRLPWRRCSTHPIRPLRRPARRPTDRLGRPMHDLRISVTDRCNFRCTYCMPKEIFGRDYAVPAPRTRS